MNAIRPELLAGKIETGWIERAKKDTGRSQAEISELLWFLQYRSQSKGGLPAFVAELIAQHPAAFGNPAMLKIGIPKDGKYSLAQCLEVWKAEDVNTDDYFAEPREAQLREWADDAMRERYPEFQREISREKLPNDLGDFLSLFIDDEISIEKVTRGSRYNKNVIAQACERFNFAFLSRLYLAKAVEKLPNYLHDLCVQKGTNFMQPCGCADLVSILFSAMRHHAETVGKTIAQTEVSRIVFRELEFAFAENVPVPIVGESRIGKTTPAGVWAAMRPGRARLVTVPETNRMRDFIEAHADAFGIEHNPQMPTAKLSALVKYVHQNSGLMVIYDEATFLIPVSYHKTTPPSRINYVRFQVIDRNLKCAFFATPQSNKQTLDQFVKTTGHRIEQWLGRLARPVILPSDLSVDDIMAVARIHFPDLPEPHLQLIAARAVRTEGYIKNLEFAAKRMRFIAAENGHTKPTLADVKQAIQEMMPSEGNSEAALATPASPKAEIKAPLMCQQNAVKRPFGDIEQPPRFSAIDTRLDSPEREELKAVPG